MFTTEESSPFDVAVVELQDSVPGFVPPRPAHAFLPGKRPVGTWGAKVLGVTPSHPPSPHPR